jgi:DNA-binding HxlR family transcriptional regulator
MTEKEFDELRPSAFMKPAPSQLFIEMLAGRWTLGVLAELADGGRRYQDIDEALEGVSHKVLTDTLRRAERDGLITRHVDPSRVETATLYQLTELGRSLGGPLAALEGWVGRNWARVETARQQWTRRND